MEGIRVASEIGRLRRVLICRPDVEQEMVDPDRMKSLLFDDLVSLPPMREAHDLFVESIKQQGVEILDARTLLKEILENSNEESKREILTGVLKLIDPLKEAPPDTNGIEAEQLTQYLVAGVNSDHNSLKIIDPIPNFIFTRDYGAVINESILISNFRKKARKREGFLAREIFSEHTIFQGKEMITCPNSPGSKQATVEGGDIQVIRPDLVLMGISERTSIGAVQKLTPRFLSNSITVITVEMPSKRSCMHLDTVFTMINRDECLIFSQLLINDASVSEEQLVKVKKYLPSESVCEYNSLLEALISEGVELKPIFCGGKEELHQRREQYTDGTNVLAVKPGVIYQYRRNVHTIEELKANGYREVMVEDAVKERTVFDGSEKIVITIPCHELSRGRGGPHCLTFPLLRDNL